MSKIKRRIKLQADYSSSPLWDVDNPDNVSLEKFKLSNDLKVRLERWIEELESGLDRDNPGGYDSVENPETVKAWWSSFRKKGALMWLELRKELADEYEVSYFISGHGLLTDPKELENFAFWTS